MGAAGSAPTTPVTSGPVDPSFDQKTSGVRVTFAEGGTAAAAAPAVGGNDFSVEDRVKQAYAKGKGDGVASFQGELEKLAAEVYDNVHTQLSDIQQKSLNKSKQTVSRTLRMCTSKIGITYVLRFFVFI